MILRILLVLGAAGLNAGEVAPRVDPVVELAGAAQFYCPPSSDPEDYRRPEGEQAKLLRARFPRGTCLALPKDFSFSMRAAAALARPASPDDFPQEAVDAAGGRQAYELWILSLKMLSETEAKVEARVVPETAPAMAAAQVLVSSWSPLARFEAYAGYPLSGRQSLVVSQFLKREAVYNVVERGSAGFEISTLVSSEAGIGTPEDHWGEGLGHMLLHESAHGLLDDLAEIFASEIEARRPEGFKPSSCNGSWRQCVKEHFAAAAAARMEAALFPDDGTDEEGEPPPGASQKEKLPYLKSVEDAFLKFEAERKRWPTLAHMYPELLDAFGKPVRAAVPSKEEPTPETIAAWTHFLETRLKQGSSEALSAKRDGLLKPKKR